MLINWTHSSFVAINVHVHKIGLDDLIWLSW